MRITDKQLHPASLVAPYIQIDFGQLENRSSFALSRFAQADVPLPLRNAQFKNNNNIIYEVKIDKKK